mmetsp:Transcript_4508/g.17119  ORF Transcript_4508/g.17119 Transcript_4508/m.17119 type:complete len:94 (+) Transcript_4508:1138-1419(+)
MRARIDRFPLRKVLHLAKFHSVTSSAEFDGGPILQWWVLGGTRRPFLVRADPSRGTIRSKTSALQVVLVGTTSPQGFIPSAVGRDDFDSRVSQ